MSCWVVPLIAAELWGVSIDHIHARVSDGSLPFKTEQGFVFVDVAPQTEDAATRPLTYTLVTRSEQQALTDNFDQELAETDELQSAAFDDGPESEQGTLPHWREVRGKVGLQRRAPRAA